MMTSSSQTILPIELYHLNDALGLHDLRLSELETKYEIFQAQYNLLTLQPISTQRSIRNIFLRNIDIWNQKFQKFFKKDEKDLVLSRNWSFLSSHPPVTFNWLSGGNNVRDPKILSPIITSLKERIKKVYENVVILKGAIEEFAIEHLNGKANKPNPPIIYSFPLAETNDSYTKWHDNLRQTYNFFLFEPIFIQAKYKDSLLKNFDQLQTLFNIFLQGYLVSSISINLDESLDRQVHILKGLLKLDKNLSTLRKDIENLGVQLPEEDSTDSELPQSGKAENNLSEDEWSRVSHSYLDDGVGP